MLYQVGQVVQLLLGEFSDQFEMILNTELNCDLQIHTNVIFPRVLCTRKPLGTKPPDMQASTLISVS